MKYRDVINLMYSVTVIFFTFSCHYIQGYFTPVQLHPLASSIPSVNILIVLTATFIITAVSEVSSLV